MTESAPDVPGRIFMSYRREDTAYPVSWLYGELTSHFGEQQVFRDSDSINPGDDFTEEISKAVACCDVLLALIGPAWLTVTGKGGQRRLDNPADFVRLEIETALTRNVRVIPILCAGAPMPRADELPDSLAKLADRQALELRWDHFEADTQRLLQDLDQTIAEARERARREPERAVGAQHPAVEPPEPDEPLSQPARTRELPAAAEAGESTRRASRRPRRSVWQRPVMIASAIAGIAIVSLVIAGVVTAMSGSGGGSGGSGGPDTSDGSVRWWYPTGSVVSSPVVTDGIVYVGSDDGEVYALKAATGDLEWSYFTQGAVNSRPAVTGGTVYVGSNDGKVYALDASTGTFRWSFVTRGLVRSGPAFGPAGTGGTVYVGSDDGKVYALNAVTGHLRWSYATGGVVSSGPAVAGGTVYVAGDNGGVYALFASTGRLRWSQKTSLLHPVFGPAVAGGTVYVGSDGGKVYALFAATGRLRWSHTVSAFSPTSAPAVGGGTVYVGSDGEVDALDAATGYPRGSYAGGSGIASSPVVIEDTAFVGENSGVFALNVKS